MRGSFLAGLLSGCFVISEEDIREHDDALQGPADGDVDADADGDVDADTDADADTDTVLPTGDTGTAGTFVLTLEGVDFDQTEGWYVVAVALDAEGTPVSAGTASVLYHTFEIVFPFAFGVGEIYSVDVLVEQDGDATCDASLVATPTTTGTTGTPTGPEPTFRVTGISGGSPEKRVRVSEDRDLDPAACASFPSGSN